MAAAGLIVAALVLAAALGFAWAHRGRRPSQQEEWTGPANLECQEHRLGDPACDVTRWRWPDGR